MNKKVENIDYKENLSHNIFSDFKERINDLLKINMKGNCNIESITYLRNTIFIKNIKINLET